MLRYVVKIHVTNLNYKLQNDVGTNRNYKLQITS